MPIAIEEINRIPANRGCIVPLFSDKKIPNARLDISGKNMFKDYKIKPLTQFTLDTLDKLSPMLNGHKKIGRFVLESCEKLMKLSENVL